MTKHYPSELKERAVRLVLDTESEPGGRRSVCTRVGGQLGVNTETLRGEAFNSLKKPRGDSQP